MWMNQIIKYDIYLTEIISTKNKLFISSYWKTFMECFFVKLKYCIAFSLQINE